MAKQKRRVDEIRRLVKSVCKPVAMPREFRKRLRRLLMREVKVGDATKRANSQE